VGYYRPLCLRPRGLSVHPRDIFIPLILVLAGGLSCATGVLLIVPASDSRPRKAAAVTLFLAVASGLAYWVTFALVGEDVKSLDIGTVMFLHVPALLALIGLVEVVYLGWSRLSSRPA
jgi:hypothetical protein